MTIPEGTLEWFTREEIDRLPIPDSDRLVIWPLFWRYRNSFFCAHLDCRADKVVSWRLEQPGQDAKLTMLD
jgi:8-oxo-dGTP diphosphatase